MSTKYSNEQGQTLFEFSDNEDGTLDFTIYYTEPDEGTTDIYSEPVVTLLTVEELQVLKTAVDKELDKLL